MKNKIKRLAFILFGIIPMICLTKSGFSVPSNTNFEVTKNIDDSSKLNVIYANHQKKMPKSWLKRINSKKNANEINQEFEIKEKKYDVDVSDPDEICDKKHYYTDHEKTNQKSIVSNSIGTNVELKWSCYDITQVDGNEEYIVQDIKDTWYKKIEERNNLAFKLIKNDDISACLIDGKHKNNADEKWHKTLKLCSIDEKIPDFKNFTTIHLYKDSTIR